MGACFPVHVHFSLLHYQSRLHGRCVCRNKPCFVIEDCARDLDFIEVFSGDQSVSIGLRLFGYCGLSVDARHGSHHDILDPLGFLVILGMLWRVREYGLVFWAPPCSWWVWICRGTSKKSEAFPKGDQSNFTNKSQNRLVARMCHLLYLCLRRRIFWIIEQPDSSLMSHYPRLARLLIAHRCEYVKLSMGAYGGPIAKGTVLFGTCPIMLKLVKSMSALDKSDIRDSRAAGSLQVTRYTVMEDGTRRSTGGKDLRGTQSYPIGFGAALGREFHELQLHLIRTSWGGCATIDGLPPVAEDSLIIKLWGDPK